MNPALLMIIGVAWGMMPGAFVKESGRGCYGGEYNRDFFNAHRKGRTHDQRAKGRAAQHWKRRAMPF